MTRVIRHAYSPGLPVIYGVAVESGTVNCTGVTWEVASRIPPAGGWVCLAARAVDVVGNVGVSPPHRVCVDPDGNGGADPCTNPGPAPSCTDGCTPQSGFTHSFIRQ
jgi:hypothetical protein